MSGHGSSKPGRDRRGLPLIQTSASSAVNPDPTSPTSGVVPEPHTCTLFATHAGSRGGRGRRPHEMTYLSAALIADIAAIISDFHTHAQIDNMIERLGGERGEPLQGTKTSKVRNWLHRVDDDPSGDALRVLGELLEELMDREVV